MPNERRPGRRHLFSGVAPVALALVAGLAGVPAAIAQDSDQADPPARVGRIAVVQGAVSFHPSPDEQWGVATVNYPVAASTALWADDGAQAEVEIGDARVRLDGGTELDVVQLDDQTVVLSVPQGRVDVSLRGHTSDERYDIQTPRGDVDLTTDGQYRIIAGSQTDPTRVAAFGGAAQLVGTTSQISVTSGQEIVATPGDPIAYSVATATPDAFDGVFTQRVTTVYARPVPPGVPHMPGLSALSEYGSWNDEPEYGHVWVPRDVAPDWQPYHDGHWGYVAPWGYTWIDNSPWGFAPFHYGRWVQVGGHWGWVAVERGAEITPNYRPVYSPAMVAFVGNPAALTVGINIGGVGVGVNLGGGGEGGGAVGWIPLGPNEPFHPWYHASDNYVRQANIVNVNKTVITNVTNTTVINNTYIYKNQQAATVVPRQAFAGGRPVAQAAVRIPPQQLSRPIEVARQPAVVERALPRPEQAALIDSGKREAKAPPPPKLQMAHPAAASAAAFHANPPPATPKVLSATGVPVTKAEAERTRTAAPEAVRPGPAMQAKPGEAPKPGEAMRPGAAKPETPAEAAKPGKPNEAVQPGGAMQARPGEAAKPGEAPKPGAQPEAAHPGVARPGAPNETAHPGVAKPETPAEAAKPGGVPNASNRPGTEAQPKGFEPPAPHAPNQPERPGMTGMPHPNAPNAVPHPEAAPPTHPAAEPPAARPAAQPHPAEAQHPAEPPHPAAEPQQGFRQRPQPEAAHPAAPPAPAPQPHPQAAPPAPAQPHPQAAPPAPAQQQKPAQGQKKPDDKKDDKKNNNN